MATMKGLDLSHWNSGFNLASSPAKFAIVKATDGTTMVDSQCDHFVNQAKNSGKKWGVYHFAYSGSDAEADFFVRNTTGYHGKGILALDWEASAVSKGPSAAKNWLDRVYAKTGIKPVIYMSGSVLSSYNWSAVAKAGYGIWVARWSSAPGSVSPWDNITLWQYTDAHSEQGYRLDGDQFYGDQKAWDKYAGKAGSDPGPDPDPDDGGTDGDDDMPKWKNTSYDKDYTVAADGEWHVLTIGGDADGIDYSFLTGPVRCSGVLNVSVQGLENDREVDLRPVVVQTQSGKPTTVVTQFPATEFFTGGASATMQMGIPFAQDVSAGSDGAAHRLRFQIRAYGSAGHKVTVSSVRARAVYWKD